MKEKFFEKSYFKFFKREIFSIENRSLLRILLFSIFFSFFSAHKITSKILSKKNKRKIFKSSETSSLQKFHYGLKNGLAPHEIFLISVNIQNAHFRVIATEIEMNFLSPLYLLHF